MKTHLFRPKEQLTMCGRLMTESSTTDPKEVTCKICLNAYNPNKDWYWKKLRAK